MKKYIKNIIIGIGIGSTTHLVMMIIANGTVESRGDLIRILIMSALIGLLSTIFSSDNLSLLTKTLIQLLGSLVLVLGTGYLNHWYDTSSLISIGIFCLIFIVIFLIIWLAIYFILKAEADKINHELAKRNNN